MDPVLLESAAAKLQALAHEARAKKAGPGGLTFNYQGLVEIIIALLTQAKPFLPSS